MLCIFRFFVVLFLFFRRRDDRREHIECRPLLTKRTGHVPLGAEPDYSEGITGQPLVVKFLAAFRAGEP